MDFTLKIYRELLESFIRNGFKFYTMESLMTDAYDRLRPGAKLVVLRHDVDRRPQNAVATARIENELGVEASYYFRVVPESLHIDKLIEISRLNHEIGYHYEDLALCNGDYEKAIKQFEENLEMFRQYYPVQTICMHGNPMSKWDNRLIWDKYDYKNYGIIVEPYFDIDYRAKTIFYATDTGRRWNAGKANRRDKVEGGELFDCHFRGTRDMINAVENGSFPNKSIINSHPERWDDNIVPWFTQLIMQNAKNVVKRFIPKR